MAKMKMPEIPKLPKMPELPFKKLLPAWGKKQTLLVLEVEDEVIQMVGVEIQGKTRKVCFAAVEPVKDLSEVDMGQRIIKTLAANNFKARSVVISHPAHNLTTRILSIPSTDMKEIKDILDLQAVKQTPYSRDEITVGFEIIGKEASGYSRVLLAISHRDIASRYVRIAELANLRTEQVTVSIHGIRKWFRAVSPKKSGEEQEVALVLNVNSATTDLLILKNQELVFARSLAYGAKHLEQTSVLETEFIREVQRSVEAGTAEIGGDKVNRAVVTGISKPLKDAAAVVSREMNMACDILPTIPEDAKLVAPDMAQKAGEFPESVVPTVGLAMEGEPIQINLIPPEVQIQKGIEERGKDLVFLGTMLFAFMTLAMAIGGEKFHKKASYLEHLKKEYSTIRPEAEEIERLVAKMRLAEEQMNAGRSFLDVLRDINDIMPDSIHLTFLQHDDKERQVVLRGISEEMSSVFQLLSTLEAAPHLEFVKTRNVTKRKIKDKDMSEFEIVAQIAKLKADPV